MKVWWNLKAQMNEANRCGADLDVARKLLEAGYLKNLPTEVSEQRLKEKERRECEWRLRQKEVDEGQIFQGSRLEMEEVQELLKFEARALNEAAVKEGLLKKEDTWNYWEGSIKKAEDRVTLMQGFLELISANKKDREQKDAKEKEDQVSEEEAESKATFMERRQRAGPPGLAI